MYYYAQAKHRLIALQLTCLWGRCRPRQVLGLTRETVKLSRPLGLGEKVEAWYVRGSSSH